MWEDNTATVLWCIGKSLGGDNWRLPSFIETAYPNKIQKDVRTGTEIINDLKERLSKQ